MPEQQHKPRRIWDEGIDMAYDLIQRHPELLADVPPLTDILFVLDRVNEPQSKGKPVMAKVSKITGKVVDFLEAGEKTWMLEWFSQNNGFMTLNQQYILLLQQLLLFEPVGEEGDHRIGGWDIQEMEVIADRLGLKWASKTTGEAPDIMADGFKWGRVGQSRINFIQARTEARRRQKEAQEAGNRPKAEQQTLDMLPKATEAKPDLPTMAAELVGAFGLQGAKAVVEAVKEYKAEGCAQIPGAPSPPPDDWQPPEPYVKPDNVVPFPNRPTGTSGTDN